MKLYTSIATALVCLALIGCTEPEGWTVELTAERSWNGRGIVLSPGGIDTIHVSTDAPPEVQVAARILEDAAVITAVDRTDAGLTIEVTGVDAGRAIVEIQADGEPLAEAEVEVLVPDAINLVADCGPTCVVGRGVHVLEGTVSEFGVVYAVYQRWIAGNGLITLPPDAPVGADIIYEQAGDLLYLPAADVDWYDLRLEFADTFEDISVYTHSADDVAFDVIGNENGAIDGRPFFTRVRMVAPNGVDTVHAGPTVWTIDGEVVGRTRSFEYIYDAEAEPTLVTASVGPFTATKTVHMAR
jgi:hypothetical protein